MLHEKVVSRKSHSSSRSFFFLVEYGSAGQTSQQRQLNLQVNVRNKVDQPTRSETRPTKFIRFYQKRKIIYKVRPWWNFIDNLKALDVLGVDFMTKNLNMPLTTLTETNIRKISRVVPIQTLANQEIKKEHFLCYA